MLPNVGFLDSMQFVSILNQIINYVDCMFIVSNRMRWHLHELNLITFM